MSRHQSARDPRPNRRTRTRSNGAVPALVRPLVVGAELASTLTVLGETAVAAQQTIALRMARLAQAAIDPAVLADPEFRRMGWEKLEAANAASAAVAGGMRELGDGFWDWGSRQIVATEEAVLSLSAAWTPHQVALAQSRFADRTLDAVEAALAHFALAASRLGGLGLGPYHTATRANARRLARL